MRKARLSTRLRTGLIALLCLLALLCIGEVMVHRAEPILRGRVVQTLHARFHARVELDGLHVSLVKGLEVSGEGLRIYLTDDNVAAGATEPLVAVTQFRFHMGLLGLFQKPMRVETVHVEGMRIVVPPKEQRASGEEGHFKAKADIAVRQIVVDNSELVLETAKADKDPKRFELRHIALLYTGEGRPWGYDAVLVNALPRGDIHATGNVGPWVAEFPGESMVDGRYTFEHADLSTIKGISGTLSSVGTFGGRLDRIVADGTTTTPDFALDSANHHVGLQTSFHAVIDGTTGDTYLQPVRARLGESVFTCSGEVINVKGHGHQTDLDVDVPAGRLQDFLLLAVKTRPPVMQSLVGMKMHLRIVPRHESVTKRLEMKGEFTLRRIHFTRPQMQDKVDELSLRAQGDAKDVKPGAPDVMSEMQGTLLAAKGRLNFPQLHYELPGAEVALTGTYSMDGNTFDFAGTLRTKARISQMVAPGWRSFLLRAADPFFARNGAGTEVPIRINGTESAPKFGLDFGRRKTEAQEQKDDLQHRRNELTPDGRIARRKAPGL